MSIYYTTRDIRIDGNVKKSSGQIEHNIIQALVQGTFGDVDEAVIEVDTSVRRGGNVLIKIGDFLTLCAEIKQEYERLQVEEGYEDGSIECAQKRR